MKRAKQNEFAGAPRGTASLQSGPVWLQDWLRSQQRASFLEAPRCTGSRVLASLTGSDMCLGPDLPLMVRVVCPSHAWTPFWLAARSLGTCSQKAPKYLLAGPRMGAEPNPWAFRPPTTPRARGWAGTSPAELAGQRSVPVSPCTALPAPVIANTLEQVGSSGISWCKYAPSTCSIPGTALSAQGEGERPR